LGTMIGYDKIPAYWKQGLDKVEHLNFAHTDMSLNKVYETGFRHASEMIVRNGGELNGDTFTIKYQEPTPVPYEKSFEGLYPVERKRIGGQLSNNNGEISFNIQGSGFVLGGGAVKNSEIPDTVLEVEVYINNELHEVAKLPTNSRIRRLELSWNYDLKEGENSVTLKAKTIPNGYRVEVHDVIVYSRNRPGKVVYY
ncbi:MAG TPA: ADP-ribosylglycohydrolase family protein, partial [Petrimonas sp.]|nr:ADP-ribosylglycohydrolase family protein [Petrimonas sp.]